MAEADLAVFGDRAGDAERLEADADGSGGVSGLGAALLERDGAADGVRPLGVLEADGLGFLDDGIGVDALFLTDGLALIDGGNAVFFQDAEDFRLASLVSFKSSHSSCPPYSLRGSIYLTASSNLP